MAVGYCNGIGGGTVEAELWFWKHQTLYCLKVILFTKNKEIEKCFLEELTEISLAPVQMRLGEGNGSIKRPTP